MQTAKAIFSERLKEMLELREKSQAQFAKELDTTPQAISSYVKGKTTPDYDMLCRIANRLSVSVDFLLGNVQTLTDEEQQLMDTDQSETDSDLFLHTFRRFAVVRDKMRTLYGDHAERIDHTSLVFQFFDELNAVCYKYTAISDIFGNNNAAHPEAKGEFNSFGSDFTDKLSALMQDTAFQKPSMEPAIISELIRMEKTLR